MKISNDKVTLRHIKEEDLARYVLWTTEETEWQKWDAPWEEDEDDELFLTWLRELVKNPSDYRLEIDTRFGKHIGWCSTYYIDEDNSKLAVGLDIVSPAQRGKGYGYAALFLFMEHLFQDNDILYAQTWSGNFPMLKLAERMGFQEVDRKVGIRAVRGQMYDGLTFAMTKEAFYF